MESKSKAINYIFITEPDDILKCSICFEVARDPKQCEDCGKLFCTECIEKNGKKPCPNCRKDNPRYFKDVRGGREIRALGVRCTSVEIGCQWTGTIGTVDEHILCTCQFGLVPCPYKCEEDGQLAVMRKDLDSHLKTACPNRAHQCQHCGENGTYASITEDHDKVCNKKIVPCPNKERGCLLSMERGKTEQHVRNVCNYTEVACTYDILGCRVRMLRKDIEEHEKSDNETHLHLSLRNACLREEQHKTLSEGEAMVFKLSEYKYKKENNQLYYSRSFYSHSQGYKMCIRVDANGYARGAGTHVSIFTQLLEGRYDNQLHWPFIGTVKYELLNQLADDKHKSTKSQFCDSTDMQVGSCQGYPKFLPHSSLSHDPATNTQYLLDDTLYFRVSVTVDNHKPWLVCTDKINMDITRATKDNKALNRGEPLVFKMTGYEDKKATDNYFFSDSFYTGPGGYNMCIRLVPNGDWDGRGTHMSVFAIVLAGSYDANLSWPFTGTVTIMLLNQLEDSRHHSETIIFTAEDNVHVHFSRGYSQFISHSALSYDQVKNTQYLIEDTLYFRVAVQVKSHKPWLKCTHHT